MLSKNAGKSKMNKNEHSGILVTMQSIKNVRALHSSRFFRFNVNSFYRNKVSWLL